MRTKYLKDYITEATNWFIMQKLMTLLSCFSKQTLIKKEYAFCFALQPLGCLLIEASYRLTGS